MRLVNGKNGDLSTIPDLRTPGTDTSLEASKHRSAGIPPNPVTAPQLLSTIDLRKLSQSEPHGVAHEAASRVLVQIWSAPPERFQ